MLDFCCFVLLRTYPLLCFLSAKVTHKSKAGQSNDFARLRVHRLRISRTHRSSIPTLLVLIIKPPLTHVLVRVLGCYGKRTMTLEEHFRAGLLHGMPGQHQAHCRLIRCFK